MKLSKKQLKKIIKEEKSKILHEYIDRDYVLDRIMEVLVEQGAIKSPPNRDDALQYLDFLVKVYDRGR